MLFLADLHALTGNISPQELLIPSIDGRDADGVRHRRSRHPCSTRPAFLRAELCWIHPAMRR